MIALIAFLGLAIDAASLYLTHARLKRAVDSAAVSAANDIKKDHDLAALNDAAREILMLHNIDANNVDLRVYNCDTVNLATLAPEFAAVCPGAGYAQKKLIYIQATENAPLYFMQLIGFSQIPLTTFSISEAAPIDLVIVIDTSESMGEGDPSFNGSPNGPGGCNLDNSCTPLKEAKDAAKELVKNLYLPYDRVSVVTYDTEAYDHLILNEENVLVRLSDDFTEVNLALDNIKLHDDPSMYQLWGPWYYRGGQSYDGAVYNPIFPDDRDGDGLDSDFVAECTSDPNGPNCCTLDHDRWDDSKDPYGWGGIPCDDDNVLDAYDFNGDGTYTAEDTVLANAWLAANGSLSINSTCAGCGIRIAGNILKDEGRPNAVWVIVFLSDGIANMTDTPTTANVGSNIVVPPEYPNGFCVSKLDANLSTDKTWQQPQCVDTDINTRYCLDLDPTTCPPGTIPKTANPDENFYTVYDWTLDMIDDVALTASNNPSETRGNDIAIYTIALGGASKVEYGHAIGEELLRYMAAVGDDGDRTTDPCSGVATTNNCGQYYYAPDGDGLKEVFEDIAGRIYTRITQ